MIKKYIGFLLAAAILGILVMTVLHHDNYRSMVWDGNTAREVPAAAVSGAGHTPARQPVSAPAEPAESSVDESAAPAQEGASAADSLRMKE